MVVKSIVEKAFINQVMTAAEPYQNGENEFIVVSL